jgi:hypothetical protein
MDSIPTNARDAAPALSLHEPLDLTLTSDGSGWTEARFARLTWAFVILGAALRIIRFALNQPLWGDEAFVAANFIDRGFLDLLRPLDYHQVCPLLFLWAELALVKLFGFSEYSLRLFPTLCSVASVFLFQHVAGRVLRGGPKLLAVGIFAVAFYPIRHGSEVKPYASDLLVALVLLAIALEWWRSPRTTGWLWGLVAFAPVALALSHPAAFVAGGISLALLVPIWKTHRWSARVPYMAFNVAIAAAFVGLFVLVIRGQAEDAGAGTLAYWANAFPPLHSPMKLVLWLLQVHTSHMVSYPIGGERGASALTTICMVAGGVMLWRRGRRDLLMLFLAPFAFGFLASCLQRYPYGGSSRTMQYVAPAVCLMTGLGAAGLIGLMRHDGARRRGLRLGTITLVAIGLVAIGRDIMHPYKMIEDQKARAFARWFWAAKAQDGELACVKRDLGTIFEPRHWELGRSAVYLCNQKIYSPRHHRGAPLVLDRVAPNRPLRCVLYNEEPTDHPAFQRWLNSMNDRYDPRGVERLISVPKTQMHDLWFEDRYVIYEFVPKSSSAIARTSSVHSTRR